MKYIYTKPEYLPSHEFPSGGWHFKALREDGGTGTIGVWCRSEKEALEEIEKMKARDNKRPKYKISLNREN